MASKAVQKRELRDSLVGLQEACLSPFATTMACVTSACGVAQVVSDLDEPFVPQPDDLLVNLRDSRPAVDALLDSLPATFANNPTFESALGPALQAAFLVMSGIGGKLMLFQTSMPSSGGPPCTHLSVCRCPPPFLSSSPPPPPFPPHPPPVASAADSCCSNLHALLRWPPCTLL